MKRDIHLSEETYSTALIRRGDEAILNIGGRAFACVARRMGAGEYRVSLDGVSHRLWIAHDRDTTYVHGFGRAWNLRVTNPSEVRAAGVDMATDAAVAPMPGVVVSVMVRPGDLVDKGQPMVVIESMKMQSEISARRAGTVEAILVAEGDTFERGAQLVSLVSQE